LGAGTKSFGANSASTTNFTVDSGSGAVTAPSSASGGLTIAGNYTNNAVFTHNSGTVYASSSSAQTFSGTATGTSAFNHVVFIGAGTKSFFAGSRASTSNFTILSGSGAVTAPTYLSIAGNYTNSGTFTAGTGITTLNGTGAQTISGNLSEPSAFYNIEIINNSATTTFANTSTTTNNFTIVTPNVRVEFAANSTTTIAGKLILAGTSGNTIYLHPSTPGGVWNLRASSTSITYTNAKDSNACAKAIDASGGNNVDGGGNTCWFFTAAPILASEANQTFGLGEASTLAATVTLVDFIINPTITAANDLRIAIATSTTFMRWDTSKTTLSFGGGASGKVSNPVSYEGGGSVLLVPVGTNFLAGEILTLSGMNFMSFGTATPALSGLRILKDGVLDQSFDGSDAKNITIKGRTLGAEHAGGQTLNQIDFSGVNFPNSIIYAFNMTPSGEQMSVTSVVFSLSAVNGLAAGDFTNVGLFVDYNANKAVDAGDTQVGGAGAVIISGQTGTLTFSSAFTATTTRNYVVKADLGSVAFSDSVTLLLSPGNIVTSGVTSLLTTTSTSTALLSRIQHIRIPHGGAESGGGAPAGQGGEQGGGGQGEGGDEIGGEPGYFPPTTSGGTFDQWTNPANAFLSDNSRASAFTSWFREDYGGFGFNIPSGNTVSGVEVKLEYSASTPAGTISVALSWNGGSATTSIKTTPTLTTTDAVVTLGSPSDAWGRTWTPAEFNDANFKVRLVAQPSGNTVRVDAIQVKVTHAGGGGGQGGGGEALLPYWRNLASIYEAGRSFVVVGVGLAALAAERIAALLTLF